MQKLFLAVLSFFLSVFYSNLFSQVNPPVITGTYCTSNTTVSGTCDVIISTDIEVFINAVSSGTTTVGLLGKNWTITGLTFSPNDVITAQATNILGQSVMSNTVTVNPPPTVANAGPDQTDASMCGLTSTTLAGNAPAVGTGLWSIVSGSGGSFGDNTSPTSIFNGTAGTSYVLQWTISNPPCTASSDDVTITFNKNPTVANAGPDQTGAPMCGLTSTTLAGNTPAVGTGLWSIVSGSGGSFGNAASPTSTFSGTVGTSYVLQWTISQAPCTVSSSSVTITFEQALTASNAGPDQTGASMCGLTSTTLAGNAPVVGTGLWSIISGSGGSFGNAASPTSTFSGTAGTSYVLQWTISHTPCIPSSSSVTITFEQGPTASNAGPNQTGASMCGLTSTTLAGNTPAIGTGSWSIVSGSGGSFGNAASSTSTFSGTAGTNYVLQWTISHAPCAASSSSVTITFEQGPTASNAGPNQTGASMCGLTSTTLAGNTPAIGTGSWSIVSGSGGSFGNAASSISTFSGTAGTSYVLQWTISHAPCTASSSSVTITFEQGPTASNAGPDQTGASMCGLTSTTLAGNTPAIGTGLWSIVSGSGGSFGNAASSTSTFSGTAGTSYVLQWTISHAPCTSSSSSVTITFNKNPVPVANAGPDQTGVNMCGLTSTTLAGNTPAIGTGSWSIVSGSGGSFGDNTSPTSTFSGIAGTTYVLQWTISNSPCAGSSDDVTIIFWQNPSIANAGADQVGVSMCGVTSTTLTATTPTVGTGQWSVYSGSGGSFGSISSPNSAFTGTAGATYVLRWTTSVSGSPCTSFDDVTITFGKNPTVANAGSDQTICSSNISLAGNTPIVGSGLWTKTSGSGIITSPGIPTSGITGLAAGTSVFIWTITNGACISSDNVSIINGTIPIVDAGPDQNFCNVTTATLAGNTPALGTTGSWSVTAGGATVNSPSNPGSMVSSLSTGANTFRWTITDAGCIAADDITINISTPPTTANAGNDQTICSTTATLAGNSPPVGSGLWTRISGSGTVTVASSHNSGVTGLTAGASVFRWTISNPPCADSYDDVIINVNAALTPANAGPDQTLCNVTTATLRGNTPVAGTGLWTKIAGNGSVTTASSPTTTVTGLAAGTSSVFVWTISNAPCTASSDTVTINISAPPSIPDAGADQTLCNATTTTLVASSPTTGIGIWSNVSGGGTITTASSPTTTVTGLAVGASSVYRWTVTNGACSVFDDVTRYNSSPPSIPDAGVDQTLCNATTATLIATPPTTGTGIWSNVSGSGSITTPGNPTSGITLLTAGTSVFRWTITNGGCSVFDDVTIYISSPPSTPDAGTDQTLCNATTTTLVATPPTTGIGIWSNVSGGGIITTASSPTTTVTGLAVGASSVFKWTVTNGSCSAFDDVTISISTLPTIPNAGADQTICNSTTATLAGNTVVTGSGLWTKVLGSGTITTPNSPTSGITGLSVGDFSIFRWTITNGACTLSDDIIINVSAVPTGANAGANQSICSSNAVLSGNTPATGSGLWTKVSGGGTVTITSPGSSTTTVSGLVAGTSVFRWTIANGACSSSDDVSIVNGNVPVINAGPDQTLCNVTTATLTGNNPASGTTAQWSVITGGASVTAPANPTSGVSNLSAGVNTFRWTITDGGCVATDDISIKVNSSPTAANAGPDQTGVSMCGVTTTTLTANTPVVGTGQWSIVSGSGGSFGNSTSPVSAFSGTADASYVLRWTVSNPPCTSSTDDVTITFRQNPTTANAGPDQTGANMCGVTTTTLTANAPVVGAGQWSIISGSGGSFGNSTSPVSAFSGAAGNTYVLRWTISNSPCTASADDVTISFWKTPTVANAGVDQTVCSGNTTLSGNNPVIGTGTWTKISGSGTVTITSPGSSTTTVTGLAAGISVFRWTVKNDSCTSFDDVSITNGGISSVNAGVDQSLCSTTSATLAGNTPVSGTTGQWSVVAGGASVTSPANPISGVVNLSLGVNTFRWTITNGTCTASDDVTINVSASPTAANAGVDQTGSSMCGLTSTALAGNTAAIGIGRWSIVSGSGGSLGNNASPISTFSGKAGTTYVLRWTISNAVCTPSSDDVTIIFWQTPTIANAGPDQTSLSSSATLSGNTPTTGTGTWSVIAGTGSVTISSNPISGVKGLSPGKNTFRWTISSPPCPDSFDDIDILATLNNLPPVAKNDTVTLAEDGLISINVQANDSDPNQDLLVTSIITGPAHGIASVNGNNIDYFPNKNFNGNDTIVYAVCDTGTPSLCSHAFVFITVTPVNDQPIVRDTSLTAMENNSATVCIPISDADAGQAFTLLSCGNPAHGTYTSSFVTAKQFCITYTPIPNYNGLDSICIIVCDNGIPSLCDTTYIFVKILKEPVIVLNVPQGFSPNGDGINDFFEITGIEKYPDNHILIFNQWGNLVYEDHPYTNKWDGTYQGKVSIGSTLPTGTYYFVLDLGDGSAPIKKYVYLSR